MCVKKSKGSFLRQIGNFFIIFRSFFVMKPCKAAPQRTSLIQGFRSLFLRITIILGNFYVVPFKIENNLIIFSLTFRYL